MNCEKQIKQTLFLLGISRPSKGYFAIIPAVRLAMERPAGLSCISKDIYVDVAILQKTSPLCVERNIRTLTKQIWTRGNHEYLNKVFKMQVIKKPTNKELIAALAEYVSERAKE